MSKIGIVIDSTVYLDQDLKNKFKDIEIVSLSVVNNGNAFKETMISEKKIIDDLKNGIVYKTSQPSPSEFVDAYNRLFNKGYEKIFVFTISSKISGTHQSANIAIQSIEKENDIYVFDTDIANYGVTNCLIAFMDELNKNSNYEHLIEFGNNLFKNSHLCFSITELQHLFRGGRLSRISLALGVLLRIKPIITMIDGKLELTHKMRSHQAIIEHFTNKIEEYSSKFKTVYLRIVDAKSSEYVKAIEEKIKNLKNIITTKVMNIGPVFSVHLGDCGYGITVCGIN